MAEGGPAVRIMPLLAALALALVGAVPAEAQEPPLPEPDAATSLGPDVKRLRFAYGPIPVAPGQNSVLAGPVAIERPSYPGYVVRFEPDLVRADGTTPPVDVVHLHHAVWLNHAHRDTTAPDFAGQRWAAAAEEKSAIAAPPGTGYLIRPTDPLSLVHMIHNQTAAADVVWITWTLDFVALDSPTGRRIEAGEPLWLDVRNGSPYPVFDVRREMDRDGDGRFTYPDDLARSPYGEGAPLNEWTVPEDGALLLAIGHVHPGGLHTSMYVERPGRGRVLVFRSEARYFRELPPTSWNLAMTHSPPDWRVGVRRGDKVVISATYETELASWYEGMGLMGSAWMPGGRGPDPFADPPPTSGVLTHGERPETANIGGEPTGLVDPRTLPDGSTVDDVVTVAGFAFTPGNVGTSGPIGNPPVVRKGRELRFENADAATQTYHTITACKAPCNRSTGLAYPLADGEVDFDSGVLGYGVREVGAPTRNRHEYALDTTQLDTGTYTYFCRVHPFMRGAFRVR
jgi:plastocyanin